MLLIQVFQFQKWLYFLVPKDVLHVFFFILAKSSCQFHQHCLQVFFVILKLIFLFLKAIQVIGVIYFDGNFLKLHEISNYSPLFFYCTKAIYGYI